MACEHCGGTFFEPGQQSDMLQGGHTECPGCGRPYRFQSPGTTGEMDMRHIPDQNSDVPNVKGNPLNEGDSGAWQALPKRDESWGSMLSSIENDDDSWVIERMTISPHEAGLITDLAAGAGLAALNLIPGVGEVADAAALGDAAAGAAGAGEAAAGAAGAGEAAAGAGGSGLAGGVGNIMKKVLPAAGRSLGFHELWKSVDPTQAVDPNSSPPMNSNDYNYETQNQFQSSHQATYGEDEDSSSPSSVKERKDTEDPHDTDPHSKSDGDNKDWEKDFSEDGGGSAYSPFSEDTFKQFLEALPDLLSGNEGKALQIHQLLDSEVPGYLDQADPEAEHHVLKLVVMNGNGAAHEPKGAEPKKAAWPMEPGFGFPGSDTTEMGVPNPGHVPNVQQQFPSGQTQMQGLSPGKCASCGATVEPGDRTCPQCMAALSTVPGQTTPKAAAQQGPVTPEQVLMVQKYLMQNGRDHEIPNVIAAPQNYARELAAIQKRDIPPVLPDNSQEPAMPPTAQEPEAEQQPGMPLPQQGMMVSKLTSQAQQVLIKHHAADYIAPVCPACSSHTTKMISSKSCKCHACSNVWNPEKIIPDDILHKGGSANWKIAIPVAPNVTALPADQQLQQFNPMQEDSSRSWLDVTGNPLVNGKQYRISIPGQSIPDIARIISIKPDSIEVEETGAYGMSHGRDIPLGEAQMNGYQFEPIEGEVEERENPPGLETNNEDHTGHDGLNMGGPDDLSTPHVTTGSVKDKIDEFTEDILEAEHEKDEERKKHPGKVGSWIITAQRSPARIVNKQKVGETKKSKLAVVPQMLYEGQPDIPAGMTINDWRGSQPGLHLEANDRCPLCDLPLRKGTFRDHIAIAHPDTLQQFVPRTQQPWNTTSKTAGANYTPFEQQSFIDEEGEARNLSSLQLDGTHYTNEDFLFGF